MTTKRYIIINNDAASTPEPIQNILFTYGSNEYLASQLEPVLKMFADAGVPAVAVTGDDLYQRLKDEERATLGLEIEDLFDYGGREGDLEYAQDRYEDLSECNPFYEDAIAGGNLFPTQDEILEKMLNYALLEDVTIISDEESFARVEREETVTPEEQAIWDNHRDAKHNGELV